MKLSLLLPLFFVFVVKTCGTKTNNSSEADNRAMVAADSALMADSIYKAMLAAEYFYKQDSIQQKIISEQRAPIFIIDSFHLAYFKTFDRLFNISKEKQCSEIPFEEGVNLFRLHDDSAIHEFLGYHLPLHEIDTDHPYYECGNKSGTEILRIVFLEGGTWDYFDEMEIRPADTTQPDKQLKDVQFVTTDGIFLGMYRDEVIRKTGNCYASSGKPGNDSIVYTRKDDELFFRYYVFKNNKLIYYRFGNIYP